MHTTGHLYPTGRGGVGNYRRLESSQKSKVTGTFSPPSHLSNATPPPANERFYGGRGGAGNVYHSSERAIFSFDEELERDRRLHGACAPVYSVVGRGGAGNYVPTESMVTQSVYEGSSRRGSREEDQERRSIDSYATGSSSGSSIMEKGLKNGAERVWEKLTRARTS